MDKDTQQTTDNNKRRVISRANLPASLPLWPTMLLILWYIHFPPVSIGSKILWGLVFAALALNWMVSIIMWIVEKPINVFDRFDTITRKIISDDITKAFSAYNSILDKMHKNKYHGQ